MPAALNRSTEGSNSIPWGIAMVSADGGGP